MEKGEWLGLDDVVEQDVLVHLNRLRFLDGRSAAREFGTDPERLHGLPGGRFLLEPAGVPDFTVTRKDTEDGVMAVNSAA